MLIPTSGVATIKARLRELSSSTNHALSDVDGHFTTLERTVSTGGSGVGLFVHQPPADGATVGVGSNFVTWFSAALAAGLSDPDLIQAFSLTAAGQALSNAAYTIQRDVALNTHAVRVVLPNLYNGSPDTLHTLGVTFTRTGFPVLAASRQVLAAVDEDSNDDGIPDAWERQWNIPVGTLSATNDSDGDGFLDGDEYVADTHPLVSQDQLLIRTLAHTGGVSTLTFPTSSNRNYFVWYSDDLAAAAWQRAHALVDPIEGDGQTNQFTDLAPNPTGRFFRLEVKVPSP